MAVRPPPPAALTLELADLPKPVSKIVMSLING